MALGGIRDYITRQVPHDVVVYGTEDLSLAAPDVLAPRRVVATRPFAKRLSVLAPRVSSLRGKTHQCASKGFTFAEVRVRARGQRVRRYGPEELKAVRVPLKLSARGIRVRDGLKAMLDLPQERANRLRWQEHRPKEPGEAILAWYGPIVEDAVVKFALNKQRGTLLIWYNPKSGQFKTGGVYVYRRLGAGEKPELRWV